MLTWCLELVSAEPLPLQSAGKKRTHAWEGRETSMKWYPSRHPTVSGTVPAMPTPHAGSQGHKDPIFLLYGSTWAGSLRPSMISDVLEGKRG